MYSPYDEGPSLNRFLLISVVLHVIVFLTFPNLYSLLESDLPGMAGGGVIQVMHVETSSVSQLSPVTDRKSEASIPKVTQPRPLPEQDKAEETAVAQPKPADLSEPKVEQSPPVPLERTEEPPPDEGETDLPSSTAQPIEEGEGELLTSEFGQELIIDDKGKEVLEPTEQIRPEPKSKPEEQISGIGEGAIGEDDESGISQSGEGLEESAPPPPGPPPSGYSIHLGGGSPVYPKDAEHEGVEGRVIMTLEVSAKGELREATIIESSGDARLDLQSQRTIKADWSFKPEDYDYALDLEILFIKKEDGFGTEIIYGDTRWLNAP